MTQQPADELTEQLFTDLLSMPGLGASTATITITDPADGQVVTFTGAFVGAGIRRLDHHPGMNLIEVSVAIPYPAPDSCGEHETEH